MHTLKSVPRPAFVRYAAGMEPDSNTPPASFCTRRRMCFAIALIFIGCLAAGAQEPTAKLTLRFSKQRFKVNENIQFDIQLMNVSAKPFYVRRRIDIYESDPLIGQYVLEVKQKGNSSFRDVFQRFLDVGPGNPPPTDEQFAARNDTVLLDPRDFIGRSFENAWPGLVGPPSIDYPQDLRGPGTYVVRVRYVPWRVSSSNPSRILSKVIVSDVIEVEVVR
jgi:hypothetical protein